MYVLKHADQPQLVDLPKDPSIDPMVAVWKSEAKPLALLAMFGAVVGGFFHYMKVGPNEEKPEEKPEAKSEEEKA
jgi:formate dehydrogenase iron-sulfur subunit